MEIKTQLTAKYTLQLNESELLWLKGYMQNKLYSDEPECDSKMRSELFHECAADIKKGDLTKSNQDK